MKLLLVKEGEDLRMRLVHHMFVDEISVHKIAF